MKKGSLNMAAILLLFVAVFLIIKFAGIEFATGVVTPDYQVCSKTDPAIPLCPVDRVCKTIYGTNPAKLVCMTKDRATANYVLAMEDELDANKRRAAAAAVVIKTTV